MEVPAWSVVLASVLVFLSTYVQVDQSNTASRLLDAGRTAVCGGNANQLQDTLSGYYANYATLETQKEMLRDQPRMRAYSSAIKSKPELIRGKVVLDVGTGTGVLAIWAAQAGAKAVYAVEASEMVEHARTMVRHNNVSHIVTVLHGEIEKLKLPEQVDLIISEWMGEFLIKETMFASVLYARDRWLKPNGRMLPADGKMHIAGVTERDAVGQFKDLIRTSARSWSKFNAFTQKRHGVDYAPLSLPFLQQKKRIIMRNHLVFRAAKKQIVTSSANMLSFDMHRTTTEQLSRFTAPFNLAVTNSSASLDILLVWFDVSFDAGVTLSTSPYENHTHWHQTGFLFDPPVQSHNGVVEGTMAVAQLPGFRRYYEVVFTLQEGKSKPRVERFELGMTSWGRSGTGWASHVEH